MDCRNNMRITKEGFLEIKRGSIWRKQYCKYIDGSRCWDGCPLFDEPIVRNMEGLKKIRICENRILTGNIEDLRE